MTKAPYYVHHSASVDEGARIGKGTRIWHGCHVMGGARIGALVVLGQNVFVGGRVIVGDGCRIQNNVSLFDGVVLEERVFVGPSAVFTNVRRPRVAFPKRGDFEATWVAADATIGAHATVISGTRIGQGAMVGAGAVVTRPVPSFALVVGCPARLAGFVCLCGEALPAGLCCLACGREYQKQGEGLGLAGQAGDVHGPHSAG